ncbi:MAG: hypothetical protein JJ975_02610 [Bacteroidia bacterium]|nr:hypothetical protein [Bacteroidia bacterium]
MRTFILLFWVVCTTSLSTYACGFETNEDRNATKDSVIEELGPGKFILSALGKNLNPSVQFGFGGRYTNGVDFAPGINIGRFYTSASGIWNPLRQANTEAETFQFGLNLFRINLLPTFYTYVTTSYDFTNYYYWIPKPSGLSPSHIDEYSRQSYLIGLNNYKKDGRSSIALKLGLGLRSGQRFYDAFSTTKKRYPYAELSYSVHLLKFRHQAYNGSLISALKNHRYKETRESIVPFIKRNFNPFLSIGGGASHAFLFFPAVGIHLWKFDLTASGFILEDEASGAVSFHAPVYAIDNLSSVTLGAAITGFETAAFYSFLIGYRFEFGKRGVFHACLGTATNIDDRSELLPSFDISYHLRLFKHK